MKTGNKILSEYNNQPIDLPTFKTLEQIINENSRAIIDKAAQVCKIAPGGNRETVARAIRGLKPPK